MSKLETAVTLSQMIADVFGTESANSLTKYSKSTKVSSRAYIEDTLVNEDILNHVAALANQTYIGYLLTALQLSNVMDNYKVVRNAIDRVATEGFIDSIDAIDEAFSREDMTVAQEGASVVQLEKSISHLAMGKVIEFDFITGQSQDGKATKVTVPIHVTMLPNMITSEVADAFISLNFTQSVSRRWKQWRAGEISFFRDFLFSADLVTKYAKAVNTDTTNVLSDMMKERQSRGFKHILNVLNRKKNNNIASSTLIISESTFARALSDAGLNFSRYEDRQRFFDASLSMMLYVVDPMYDTVTAYFNGLREVGEYSFSQLERASGSNSKSDLKMIMDTLSKGSVPRF